MQYLLCCEEGSDVILIDDLLEDLNAGTVCDHTHNAVLGNFAHGGDLVLMPPVPSQEPLPEVKSSISGVTLST